MKFQVYGFNVLNFRTPMIARNHGVNLQYDINDFLGAQGFLRRPNNG